MLNKLETDETRYKFKKRVRNFTKYPKIREQFLQAAKFLVVVAHELR